MLNEMKNLSIAAVCLAAVMCGCTERVGRELPAADCDNVMTKVLRLADEYDARSVLLKFSAVPDEDAIASVIGAGAVSVEPLFTSAPGREETEAAFGLNLWYEAVLPEGVSLEDVVHKCASLSEVKTVEYNHIASKGIAGGAAASSLVSMSALPFNDPYLSYQWHYHNDGSNQFGNGAVTGADIGVREVWSELGIGGDPDIVVAVVDEGVKYTHPDLVANMWINKDEIPDNGIDDDGNGYVDDVYGYNFCDDGVITWNRDGDTGHGTHCAGTVAAVNSNGIGVSGVAGGTGKGDGCRIMSCQIFSGQRGGSATVIAKAIKYAADMGASVISCSYGYTMAFSSDNDYVKKVSSVEIDVIHYFESCKNNDVLDGGIAVFSAGNESHDYAHYPGAFVDVISVSAFAPDFLPAYYTNYGPGCNIAAPGGEMGLADSFASMVLSTIPSEISARTIDSNVGAGYDYGYMQGTSMACPHVSGVVALALSYAKKRGKTFSRSEFKEMVLSSANDMDQKIGKTASKSYQNVHISGGGGYYKAHADLIMSPYYHQMGTGGIDAWQLMMKIDGTPSIIVSCEARQWVSLDSAFGTSSVSLSYLDVSVPESVVSALGLQRITAPVQKDYPAVPESGYAYVQYGRLYIHPTKVGSGVISISAIGGGSHLGGGDNAPGGMEMSRDISIVCRPFKSGNQGWL